MSKASQGLNRGHKTRDIGAAFVSREKRPLGDTLEKRDQSGNVKGVLSLVIRSWGLLKFSHQLLRSQGQDKS